MANTIQAHATNGLKAIVNLVTNAAFNMILRQKAEKLMNKNSAKHYRNKLMILTHFTWAQAASEHEPLPASPDRYCNNIRNSAYVRAQRGKGACT